jgi:hypothetical protein
MDAIEKHPAGAKAQRLFVALAARLKSCPDASGLFIGFLGSLLSQQFFWRLRQSWLKP